MLNGILLDARESNARDGITGALVCRRDIYLQLLEGPGKEVEAAFARIGRDDRHLSIRKRVSKRIPARTFADWAMLHDPEKSWIWSEEDLSDGVLDRASEAEIERVFADLAEKIGDNSPE